MDLNHNYLGKIYVSLKPTVNDPQGLAVQGSLRALGFESILEVRVGKFVEISLVASNQQEAERLIDSMCQRLLANPVIERYTFEVLQLKS